MRDILFKTEDGSAPKDGVFAAKEHIDGRRFDMEFHWVPIEELHRIKVYPTNCRELISSLDGGVEHFIYKE